MCVDYICAFPCLFCFYFYFYFYLYFFVNWSMTRICMILADMHNLHMIHTDLKPENVLLVSSESVKLPSSKVHL